MTDQYVSLSLAALKDIIAGVDSTLALLKNHQKPLASAEENVRKMLLKVRDQLEEQIEHHPDNRS